MRVAIEGCCHGCLDQIYKAVSKKKVDLLIICGDFQSIRNKVDLQSMSVPDKYKRMGDFQDYYMGKKKAPVFTIFIGGNHEASSYLEELKYGGFVAPNIYYMGRTSAIWYKGLRIGAISGVYWKNDFMKLAPECYTFPLQRSTLRAIYHYRKDDYFKLKLFNESNKTVMVSHDWPEGIYNYGNLKGLLKNKPFFKADIEKHDLGSPFNMSLLKTIHPRYWFSAHLHVRFVATVNQEKKDDNTITRKRTTSVSDGNDSKKAHTEKQATASNDEIVLDMDMDVSDEDSGKEQDNKQTVKDVGIKKESLESLKLKNNNEIDLEFSDSSDGECKPVEAVIPDEPISTKFLALDKCLPRRNYLEVLDIELTDKNHISTKNRSSPLYFDEEYISSMRVIEKYKHKLDGLSYEELLDPPAELLEELKTLKEFYMKEYQDLSDDIHDLFKIDVKSFVRTAKSNEATFKPYVNPQTEAFKQKFLK